MATSANSVFHYTGKFEYLQSIIEKGFYPSYCKESIHRASFVERYAVPMVSFCDVPLASVKDHIDAYGSYGIGLTIDWAIKNKLNPVQYLQESSTLTKGINAVLDFILKDWHELLDDFDFEPFYDQTYAGIVSILQSVKPYIGDYYDSEVKQFITRKFYDEREWRYTPVLTPDDIGRYKDIYWEVEYEEKEQLFPTKPHFKDHGIDFRGSDVKYILVKEPGEIPELINTLKKATRLHQGAGDFEILLTKIFTIPQLLEDI